MLLQYRMAASIQTRSLVDNCDLSTSLCCLRELQYGPTFSHEFGKVRLWMKDLGLVMFWGPAIVSSPGDMDIALLKSSEQTWECESCMSQPTLNCIPLISTNYSARTQNVAHDFHYG